jgi:methyl-accepting chemotaxis protein
MRVSIRTKLQLLFGGSVTILLALIVVFVYLQVTPMVTKLIDESASETAGRYAATLQGKVGEILATARTLGDVVSGVDRGRSGEGRSSISLLLKSALERNQDFYSVWSTWKPNALDGLDARFKDTKLGNDAGRFNQTWYRGADDTIKLSVEREDSVLAASVYTAPLKSNQETVIGPYLHAYEDGAPPSLETSIIVPLQDENLSARGVLGIDTNQSVYQRVVASIKPLGSGFAVLYAPGGVIAGHADQSFLGKKLEDEASSFSDADFKRYTAAITSGKETELKLAHGGSTFTVVAKPFRLGSTYTNWTLALFLPDAALFSRLEAMVRILAIAAVFSLIGILVLVFFVSNLLAKPIIRVSSVLKDISMGEGDLSLRLPVMTTDETGELAEHFNAFVSSLESTMVRLKAVSTSGAAVGSELAANSEETSATAEELAATVRSLSSKVTTLDGSIKSVGEAVDAIGQGIGKVGSLVGRQSEAVEDSAASSEAIIKALGAMSATAKARGELADGLVLRAREGEAVVGKVLEAVKDIGGYAERIAEMAGVINDVAERTNLTPATAARASPSWPTRSASSPR